MPFICAFCKVEIQAGELIQPDTMMNLAHRSCVERELKKIATVVKPVVPSPPPPAPPSPQAAEPCLLPRAPSLCVVCQKPAIAICPCGAVVHQDYGYNGQNCSGRHEATCERAQYSRAPISDIEKAAILLGEGGILVIGHPGEFKVSANGGVHKPRGACGRKKKSRGRR